MHSTEYFISEIQQREGKLLIAKIAHHKGSRFYNSDAIRDTRYSCPAQSSHNKNPADNKRNAIAGCIVRLPRFAHKRCIEATANPLSLATSVLVENGSADTWVQH